MLPRRARARAADTPRRQAGVRRSRTATKPIGRPAGGGVRAVATASLWALSRGRRRRRQARTAGPHGPQIQIRPDSPRGNGESATRMGAAPRSAPAGFRDAERAGTGPSCWAPPCYSLPVLKTQGRLRTVAFIHCSGGACLRERFRPTARTDGARRTRMTQMTRITRMARMTRMARTVWRPSPSP